jgi:solute carrier family 44 protein 1 (choline transporter-like protein)/choline transporter-like protein 2/4/5
MQFAISHGTTKIFIVFGKLMIVAICCLSGYFSLVLIDYYKNNIYSPVFLTILFAIVSFPIASAFLSLF